MCVVTSWRLGVFDMIILQANDKPPQSGPIEQKFHRHRHSRFAAHYRQRRIERMPRAVAREISSSSWQTARSIRVASLPRPKLVAFDRNELDFLLSRSALIDPRPSAAGGRYMPRVLIIERTRSQRKGKKAFKQSVEFVPRRSLEKRLARLQESGGGAIIQRAFPRSKKKRRSTPFSFK